MSNRFFAEGRLLRTSDLSEKLMTTNLQSTDNIQLTFNQILIHHDDQSC